MDKQNRKWTEERIEGRTEGGRDGRTGGYEHWDPWIDASLTDVGIEHGSVKKTE